MRAYLLTLVGLLALILPGSSAEAPPGDASEEPVIAFTDEEQAYIDRGQPVTMCVDPDWEPFERINEDGEHEGIAADLVQLVARRVGLEIVLRPTSTWDESLAASKNRHCQILSFLNDTPARREWLIFTAPIFYDPNVIITRNEHPHVGDLHGLGRETVALPRGTMVEERIRALYPNLDVVLTGSENEAIALVSDGEADMTIRSLVVAAYTIRKDGLFNLKISGQVSELTNELRIGIVREETILRSILDRGVATLTPREREAISNRHVTIEIRQTVDYSLVIAVAAGAGVLLVLAYLWNRKLRRLNSELARMSVTDPLTGLFNRMRIDDILDAEVLRATRTGEVFSVLMIDVDRFKTINDIHGHQAGDRVLERLAERLRSGIRITDTAGRWGGEEFIIVCPATDVDGAAVLAEQLRATFAAEDLPKVGHETISLGVAAWHSGERAEDVVGRADAALYEAKRRGRNQICVSPEMRSSERPRTGGIGDAGLPSTA